MRRNDSPAKRLLASYIPMLCRWKQLINEMEDRYEDANRLGMSYDRDRVQTSGRGDQLEESVIRMMELGDRLSEAAEQTKKRMDEILMLIDRLSDERMKLVITKKYIKGTSFPRIQMDMNYERTSVYEFHSRAIQEINEMLKERTKTD